MELFNQKRENTDSISFTNDSQKKEVFEQLLIVLKNNYIKTATGEEKASRYFTDESNASSFFRGTRYNFNELPDWELFKNRITSLLEMAP